MRRLSRLGCVRAAALALVAMAASGNAAAISLQQAYEAALKNDPTYRARFYASEAAKENRILGRSQLLPSVSASFSGYKNVVDKDDYTFGSRQTTHPRYISRSTVVQLRQPLFNMEAIQRYRQGKVQSEQGEAQFAADTNEVAVRMLTAYADVLFAEDQLALARVQRDMYLEQQQLNERLFKAGEGTRTDMLETRARLDLAEAQLIESMDNVAVQRDVLEGIIGQDPGTLDRLSEDFRVPENGIESFDYWQQIALKHNKDLAAARLAVENARLDIGRNKSGHLPRLDFVASYTRADSETINTANQETVNRSVGIQLNVPIYAGGAVNAQTRQAAAGYNRALSELDATTEKLMVELRRAHSVVQSGARKVDALVAAVESAQLLMKATEQSIKGGVRINLDLLTAQQQLFTSQRDLAQARYAYLVSLLRLRALCGKVDAQDIREIAAYFR